MSDLYEMFEKTQKNDVPSSGSTLYREETNLNKDTRENKENKEEGDMSLFNELRTFNKNNYENSKAERTDKSELLIPKEEPKLFKIIGGKAQEYTNILKTLNVYDQIAKENPNFDFTYFELDKGGCDPRVMDVVPDYLDKHVIIASSHQKNMDVLKNNYSFLEPMLDEILDGRAKDTIAAITPYELLFGELHTGLETLVKQINFGARHLVESGYFEISLGLDTYNNSIKKMVEVRDKALAIMNLEKQGVVSILDYNLEDEILSTSRDLNKTYVDISKFVLGDGDFVIDDIFPLKIKTNSYKYTNDEMEIYSFRNGKYMFIYFELGDKKAKTTFLDEKNYLVINGNDTAVLLSKLHENNMLDFNLSPKYIQEKMIEVEQRDFAKYSAENDDMKIKKKKSKTESSHSPLFFELESTLKEIGSDGVKNEREYMKDKSVELKLALMYPIAQDRLVYELLAKVNKDESIMTYTWDSVTFKKRFNAGNETEKTQMLQEIMEGVKYEEQYNLQVNKWLSDNYGPLCEKLGIKFVSGE